MWQPTEECKQYPVVEGPEIDKPRNVVGIVYFSYELLKETDFIEHLSKYKDNICKLHITIKASQ